MKYTIKDGKKYILQGECKRCGECCKGITYYVGIEKVINSVKFKKVLDVAHDRDSVCTSLNDNNLCSAHGKTKSKYCCEFPVLKEELDILPNCGFKWIYDSDTDLPDTELYFLDDVFTQKSRKRTKKLYEIINGGNK